MKEREIVIQHEEGENETRVVLESEDDPEARVMVSKQFLVILAGNYRFLDFSLTKSTDKAVLEIRNKIKDEDISRITGLITYMTDRDPWVNFVV